MCRFFMFILPPILGIATGCQSGGLHGLKSDERLSTDRYDVIFSAHAHPAAYGLNDAYTVNAPQKIRPANDFKFYFKDCEATDPKAEQAFFSKTAYSCGGYP